MAKREGRPPTKQERSLSEYELLQQAAEMQQERGQQALGHLRQAIAYIRQHFGFDVQFYMLVETGGQIVIDFKLVPIPGWQPPHITPDNGDGQEG